MINSAQISGTIDSAPIYKTSGNTPSLELVIKQVQYVRATGKSYERKFTIAATGKVAEFSQKFKRGDDILVIGALAMITKETEKGPWTFLGIRAFRIYGIDTQSQDVPAENPIAEHHMYD